MQVLPGHALADFPLSLSRRWLLLLRTDATQYVEHTHITTLSSKHTHMYQPRKQAKEACVTIAAQQRNANEPVKLPAAAKMARIYHLSSLTGPTKHRKRGSTRPVRLCCCRARHGARPRADPTWRGCLLPFTGWKTAPRLRPLPRPSPARRHAQRGAPPHAGPRRQRARGGRGRGGRHGPGGPALPQPGRPPARAGRRRHARRDPGCEGRRPELPPEPLPLVAGFGLGASCTSAASARWACALVGSRPDCGRISCTTIPPQSAVSCIAMQAAGEVHCSCMKGLNL